MFLVVKLSDLKTILYSDMIIPEQQFYSDLKTIV